jgi:hypothetical protein
MYSKYGVIGKIPGEATHEMDCYNGVGKRPKLAATRTTVRLSVSKGVEG